MPERSIDVLLVGGGVASVRCARTLRRRGFTGTILLVGDEPHPPYNRPPLTKELLREPLPTELVAAEAAGWYERRRVELQLDSPVTDLRAAEHVAQLADGTRVRFERCLLATGAAPRRPPIPGAEHALLLRTLDDALELRGRAAPGRRAVVIGGGFIGVEAAASLAARGVAVTVLELSPALWGGSLGGDVAQWARSALEATGIAVRTDVVATRLEPDAAWIAHERLAADMVLAGVGVRPRDDLAAAAGLATDDGVLAGADHATSAPGIFAAGDAARVDGRRVEHWHAAREGGERAALAMLGEEQAPHRAPWVFSEFADQVLDVLGHAPTWDTTHVLGDPASGRFVVAYLVADRVAQVSVVNAAIPVETARSFVERRPTRAELRELPIGG